MRGDDTRHLRTSTPSDLINGQILRSDKKISEGELRKLCVCELVFQGNLRFQSCHTDDLMLAFHFCYNFEYFWVSLGFQSMGKLDSCFILCHKRKFSHV